MDSAAARSAGIVLETLLLSEVLAPLSADFGAFGTYGTQCVAEAIARSDRHGFAAALAASLEHGRG